MAELFSLVKYSILPRCTNIYPEDQTTTGAFSMSFSDGLLRLPSESLVQRCSESTDIERKHQTYRVWITDSILIGDHLPANWFAHILEHWVTNSFKTYVFRVMLLFRRWSHATGHHQWLSRDASTGKEQHLKDFLRKRLHELEAGPAGGGQCREWQEWHTDWTVDPYSAESLCRRMDWRPQIR